VSVRRVAAFLALLVLAGCTGDPSSPTTSSRSPHAPVAIPDVAAGGAKTAAGAIRSLCVPPTIESGPAKEAGETPAAIADVERAVEQVRGFTYLHPVAVEQIDDVEMDRKLTAAYEDSYPKDLYDRRTVAWRTIGVIPSDADLHASLRAFLTGAVVGFYDQETGELVFLGSGDDLGLIERLTLAHELTHAIDDQHFDLQRLDPLVLKCQDERFTAALGLVEGSAQYFSSQVLLHSDIDLADLGDAFSQEQPDLSGVPPFVVALQEWPYLDGMTFVTALAASGGTGAVDDAMASFPVSTEQVMHPERYPGDVPTAVDIGDISGRLGPDWGDLDAMQVGEEWLRAWLDLKLGVLEARSAAAGWDGGVYRAWTDGTDVVVIVRTAWDSAAQAEEFARALGNWVADEPVPAEVRASGREVTAAFATTSGLVKRAHSLPTA
jgi:hypothetical protein